MNYFNNLLKHLGTVRRHRKYVRQYCWQLGLYWQGLTHDLSKYSFTELRESIKYYQGASSPIDAAKKDKGYSDAWFHHRGRNKHHYEYWMDNFDNGGENLVMPDKYFLEMLCDYLGASKAYNPSEKHVFFAELKWWYNQKMSHCSMNPIMKKTLTKVLFNLAMSEMDGHIDALKNQRDEILGIYDFYKDTPEQELLSNELIESSIKFGEELYKHS